MNRKRVRQVLISINIGGVSGRDCLTGILRRINADLRWNIQFEQDRAKAMERIAAEPKRFDGVITEYPQSPESQQTFAETGLPVVFTDYADNHAKRLDRAVFLRLDDEAIGLDAFRCFAALGKFGSWVFATDAPAAKYSVLRQRGFASALKKAEKNPIVRVLAINNEGRAANDAAIRVLTNLPKPIAIFAAYDPVAFALLNLCRQIGVSVPGQAAVLGVDNDEVLCTNAKPTISSILPDHVGLGARAAEELQRLMNGGRGGTVILPQSSKEIIRRDSTRILPPAEHLIRSALDFIARNAESAITVADVVSHLKVSRPLADLRFRELHGETIGRAIAKTRLEAVKKRLRSSNDTAGLIAQRLGFRTVSALSRFFRRETGHTLSSWRAGTQSRTVRRTRP